MGNPWVRISHTVPLLAQPVPVQPQVRLQRVMGTVLHETCGADGTCRSSDLHVVKNLFRNLIKFNKNLFMWWAEVAPMPPPLLVSVYPCLYLPGCLFVLVPARLLICMLAYLCRFLLPHHARLALVCTCLHLLVCAGPHYLVALVWPTQSHSSMLACSFVLVLATWLYSSGLCSHSSVLVCTWSCSSMLTATRHSSFVLICLQSYLFGPVMGLCVYVCVFVRHSLFICT